MDVTDLHQRTVAEFVSRLDTVGDKWSAPTPCSDWDVRALVNHIAYEDLWTVPLMEGATIAEVGDRFEGDLLGDDPVATARAAWRPTTRRTNCCWRSAAGPTGRADRSERGVDGVDPSRSAVVSSSTANLAGS